MGKKKGKGGKGTKGWAAAFVALALGLLAGVPAAEAATVAVSFTGSTSGSELHLKHGDSFTYAVSGTFSGTAVLEYSNDGGYSWVNVLTTTTATSGTIRGVFPDRGSRNYRFRCTAYTSGTIVTRMVEQDRVMEEFVNDAGTTVFQTLEGGVSILASNGLQTRWANFKPAALTTGTSTQGSPEGVYMTPVFVPVNTTFTGFAVNNGATVGTNKYIVALFDKDGNVLANSATAGTTTAGADAYQAVPFTATYAAKGPALYWVGLYINGTTDRFRTIPALGAYVGNSGSVGSQTFGTVSAVTPPTTFTAGEGPVGYLY